NVSETSYGATLWFNTTCNNCGIFSVTNGAPGSTAHDRHIYLSSGNVCARVWNNETICTTGVNYADGRWHHVAHTFGGSVGGQKIYMDGVQRASGNKASSDFNTETNVLIG